MKKRILFLLTITILLTGCILHDEYKMPKEVSIDIKSEDFIVYSDLTIKDVIKDVKNAKITNENLKLDTDKLGVHNNTITYTYKEKKYKYDFSYNVIDNEAPKILYVYNNKSTYVGKEIDLCEDVNYIDNYDSKPVCEIDGEYDINTPGTYYLEYNVKDRSDNIKKENLTLEVIEEPNEDEDYYEYDDVDFEFEEDYEVEEETGIKFQDIIKNYKTDNTMIGIDISRWQEDVNFDKIKKSGCEFVIIRMAVSNGPDDEIGLDSRYKHNIEAAKKAGLKVGVYVYTTPSSKDEIIKQAKFVRKNLNKIKLDFPIAYDFEDWSSVKELELTTHKIITYLDEFNNILSKDNYEVMLYSSKFYLENVWPENNYKTWLAHYTDYTNYQGKYIMWQLTDEGIIDGINGYVDVDIYYKGEND